MDWVKLSSRYYLDVAIASLPDADTEVMFTRALAYAGDQETGGFIPAGMLPGLCRSPKYEARARALVASGLWAPARNGYQITRWEEWQAELDAIAHRRSADRERKRRERERERAAGAMTAGHRGGQDRQAPAQPEGMSRDIVNNCNDLGDPPESQVRGMSRDMSADSSSPIERRESKNSSANAEEVNVRDDVERLCTRLADRVEANGSRRPAITAKWRDAARLMLDRDGRTEQQISGAIEWSQDHEFWRSNILSMPKLREKYDQLRLQALGRSGNGRQAETDQQFARQMERARTKESHDANGNGSAGAVRPLMLPAAGHG